MCFSWHSAWQMPLYELRARPKFHSSSRLKGILRPLRMSQSDHEIPQHFYSLDVLRGVAALVVVLWHWQIFFFSGTQSNSVMLENLPLSASFSLFYTNGWLAVDLFFSLSGFVFYWLYSHGVVEGKISPWEFVVLRFSRLYPLHLATLFIVSAGQFWFLSTTGEFYAHPFNDGKHFLLNLMFASGWGFEQGHSFNAPIWSVSIEVLLYAMFFASCRLLPIRFMTLFAFASIGFLVISRYAGSIGRGMGCFFIGGCIFLIYQQIVTSGKWNVRRCSKWVSCLTITAWIPTILDAKLDLNIFSLSLHSTPFIIWRSNPYFSWIAQEVVSHWPTLIVFPLTILSLTLLETTRGTLGKRCSFLGNISYSSYLLHFPLQLVTVALVTQLNISRSTFYSPWFMILFFGCLLLVSLFSYHYFEVPIQRFIRRKGLTISSTECARPNGKLRR